MSAVRVGRVIAWAAVCNTVFCLVLLVVSCLDENWSRAAMNLVSGVLSATAAACLFISTREADL